MTERSCRPPLEAASQYARAIARSPGQCILYVVAGYRKALKSEGATSKRVDRGQLQELVRSLALLADPGKVMQHVGNCLHELFGPDLVLLLQAEPGQEHLVPVYYLGYKASTVRKTTIPTQGRLSVWLTSRGRCASLARDLELLEHLETSERKLLTSLRVQYCVPLVSLRRLIGMVFLGFTAPEGRLGEEDEQLLNMLSAQAALALDNAVLHSQQDDRSRRLYRAERLAVAGKLAVGVAHEIRNPLTVINSTVEYIFGEVSGDDPRRGLADAVLQEVARLNRTIEGLLSLGKVREARPVEIDILKPLERALVLVEGQARTKGVRMEKQYSGQRLTVHGDPDQLQQVFLNLLLNALQATEPGGLIRVRTEARENLHDSQAGREVQIEIADTGCGISEADLDRIFDPFFTTSWEGSGLGLAICQPIVERHGGEIDVRSRLGRGTTILVRLPRIG